MRPLVINILEGGFGPRGFSEELGMVFFMIACAAFIISVVILLIAFIIFLLDKEKQNKLLLKSGLIVLFVSGISFLLTSILCGWYG